MYSPSTLRACTDCARWWRPTGSVVRQPRSFPGHFAPRLVWTGAVNPSHRSCRPSWATARCGPEHAELQPRRIMQQPVPVLRFRLSVVETGAVFSFRLSNYILERGARLHMRVLFLSGRFPYLRKCDFSNQRVYSHVLVTRNISANGPRKQSSGLQRVALT